MATSASVTDLFSSVSAIQHSVILIARNPLSPFSSDDQARLGQQSQSLGESAAALFAEVDPGALDQAQVDNASNHVLIVQTMVTAMQENPDDHSVTSGMFFANVDAAIDSLSFL